MGPAIGFTMASVTPIRIAGTELLEGRPRLDYETETKREINRAKQARFRKRQQGRQLAELEASGYEHLDSILATAAAMQFPGCTMRHVRALRPCPECADKVIRVALKDDEGCETDVTWASLGPTFSMVAPMGKSKAAGGAPRRHYKLFAYKEALLPMDRHKPYYGIPPHGNPCGMSGVLLSRVSEDARARLSARPAKAPTATGRTTHAMRREHCDTRGLP